MAFAGTVNPYANQMAFAQNLRQSLMQAADYLIQQQQQKRAGQEMQQLAAALPGYMQNLNQPPAPMPTTAGPRGANLAQFATQNKQPQLPAMTTPIAQQFLANVLAPSLVPQSSYQQLARERLNYWKKTGDPRYLGVGGATNSADRAAKPLTETDMGRMESLVGSALEGTEVSRWGRKNFRGAEVNNAWEQTKKLTRYDSRRPEDKEALFNLFETKLATASGGGEYESDALEKIRETEMGGGNAGGGGQGAVDTGGRFGNAQATQELSRVMPTLSAADQEKVRAAIRNGYSAAEILEGIGQ